MPCHIAVIALPSYIVLALLFESLGLMSHRLKGDSQPLVEPLPVLLPAPMAKWEGFGLCWVELFGLGRPGEPRRLRKSNPDQGEACREVA